MITNRQIKAAPPGRRLFSGLKDITVLTLLALMIMILTVVIIDSSIYPLAHYAVKNSETFSHITGRIFIIIAGTAALLSLIGRIRYMVKNRFTIKRVAFELISRPLYFLILSAGIITALAAVIAVISLILNVNSDFLKRI